VAHFWHPVPAPFNTKPFCLSQAAHLGELLTGQSVPIAGVPLSQVQMLVWQHSLGWQTAEEHVDEGAGFFFVLPEGQLA